MHQQPFSLLHMKNEPMLVVADDTDSCIMLLYHWKKDMNDIFLLQEHWKRAWSIKNTEKGIQDIKNHLLFIHAWSGCDTTSSIFGKGKGSLVQFIRKSNRLKEISEVITNV